MGDARVVPKWLKSLPLAPEYRPTDTEFADPIAFISRIEQEASAFGICKVIPPLPKPSKRFVFANLIRSLSNSPDHNPASDSKDAAAVPVFTTRQQELGSKKPRGPSVHKQVWQSGEFYTLEQFEAKSKAFAKTQLGSSFKELTPLEVETQFWKAAAEKPIYIEYANDVPGSGFAVPEDMHGYHYRRRRGKKARFRYGRRSMDGSATNLPASGTIDATESVPQPDNSEFKKDMEGTAGWKLSNCPWNLQVIARSPGSLTRFMPDEVPGVTSPMVYIAMLFSWFAWHVEDHELHSLNFLHTGAPKTWYAVPGDYATTLEEVVHQHGYGDNLDKLAAYMVLGEKRTLLSPEILVASGIPCCRLVQNPGEFVVTFPRSYHVGFSHGFNCGEAANFATSKWLELAKEAATRRAAMNYLPMLSHQQLLYMLAMSFISRVPREFLPGARSSRLRDRRKEERELLVKKAFLQDFTHEQKLLRLLLRKKQGSNAVLWDSDLLPPAINNKSSSQQLAPTFFEQLEPSDKDRTEGIPSVEDGSILSSSELEKKSEQNGIFGTRLYTEDCVESACIDDGDLPCGLDADSGVLVCVACGILGYPFMCIIQPSGKASQQPFAASKKKTTHKFPKGKKNDPRKADILDSARFIQENFAKQEITGLHHEATSASDSSLAYCDTQSVLDISTSELLAVTCSDQREDGHQLTAERDGILIEKFPSDGLENLGIKNINGSVGKHFNGEPVNSKKEDADKGAPCFLGREGGSLVHNWNTSHPYLRPRIFCLRHALEVEDLLLGESRILIICNSDYLKIKGQALSIVGEIGVQLNTEDIPLINASKEELDLINFSIDDDDDCNEQEEDWTIKLGLNLRHFVQGRKQSSQKQELFSLALGELFSDKIYHRLAPSLSWKGKRSRTPYRMMAENKSKQVLKIEGHIKEDKVTTTTAISSPIEEPHMSKNGEPCDMRPNKRQKHHINGQVGELHQLSGAVPCGNTVDAEKQGASGRISCSDSEFVDKECLDDNWRRDSSSPASNSFCEVSEPAIPGILPLSPAAAECCYPPVETEVPVRESVEVNNVEVQNSCNMVLENLVHCEKLACMKSNSEYTVDPDVSNDQGTTAANTSEPQSDNSLVDKSELATGMEDSAKSLTKRSNSIEIGNSNLLHPMVSNSSENDACSDEITEPCLRITVSDKVRNAVDQVKSELAGGIGDSVHLGTVCSDPTTIDYPKSPQPIMDNSFENDTCSDDTVKPCTTVAVSDKISNAVDQEATALKEKSSERCIADSLSSKCQMNASTSLRVSCEPYEALQVRTTGESGNPPPVKSLANCYVYVRRRKKLNEKMDKPTMHSCTEKSLGTSKNTHFDAQNIPASNLDATSGPASSDEGNGCSNDGNSTVRKNKAFKRKREVDRLSTTDCSSNNFIRGPCEGLRARTGRITYEEPKIRDLQVTAGYITKKPKATATVKRKSNAKMAFVCGLEGCTLGFQTKEELNLHKRNRCTYDGCGKRFRNHRYAMRHQRVHDNNRPFKCPWKGCPKSFNWEWARTEHLRLHTGERPYKCSDPECGLTFRFISDFSRHRRKTGHGADG